MDFDRVVNVVDDLGLDPYGNEPIQGVLNSAEQEGTLFVFPEGEYLVTDRILLLYNHTTGMLGKGDVRFTVPEWFNDIALFIDRGEYGLFENIDIDLQAHGATPGLKFGAHTEAQIRDVEFIGQGIHPDSEPRGEGGSPHVQNALMLLARDESATVVAENVVARNDGLMGAYNGGEGRAGVWVGRSTHGTVTLRNCHFSGFPNNGLYTSRTHGVVQVEGGTFRNSDICQIRLGSEGSYVRNAVVEVDADDSGSPNPWDAINQRGVRIESGPIDTAGVTVEDCDVHVANTPNSNGGVVGASPAGHFEVRNTRIRMDVDWAPGVRAQRPADGGYAPPWPRNIVVRGVSITGDATGGQAILLESRADSVIRNCCIEQEGAQRRGIRLADSSGTVVRDSTIDVTGERFDFDRTNANTWGNSDSGSCPVPDMGGGAVSTIDDGESGSTAETDSSEWRRITLQSEANSRIDYELEVSGELRAVESRVEDGELEDNTRAAGATWEGAQDQYEFTGEISELVVRGDGSMAYSGDRIKFYGNETGDALPYTATVDDLWNRASDDWDDINYEGDRPSAVGAIGDWSDEFGCEGRLHEASMEDVFSVTVE